MARNIAAFVLLAAVPIAALAGESRSQFTVSAYVPARASIEAVSQPATLTVSADDVARGYVDVPTVYRVQSNDPAGYLLRLMPRTGLTRSVEVMGLSSRVVMRGDTVEVRQPAAFHKQPLALRFRLVLDPAAVPGSYALPVHVAVVTL